MPKSKGFIEIPGLEDDGLSGAFEKMPNGNNGGVLFRKYVEGPIGRCSTCAVFDWRDGGRRYCIVKQASVMVNDSRCYSYWGCDLWSRRYRVQY